MNKQIVCFLIIILFNSLRAEAGDRENHLYNYDIFSSKQYLQYKLNSITTIHYASANNFSLFNDNVNFSNRNHTYNSLLKMGGEALTGGILGFALGSVAYNAFEPKVKGEGTSIGRLIQFAVTGAAATAGITNGVYYLGKLLGDEGDMKNIFLWMAVSGTAALGIVSSITPNEKLKLWIPLAALPIGAAFGFNTNDLTDWIFLER